MMPAAGALRREFRSCTEASRLRRQVLAEQEERLRRARREECTRARNPGPCRDSCDGVDADGECGVPGRARYL